MLAFRNPIQFVVTTTTRQDNHPQQTQVPVGLSTHEVLRWIAPTSAKQSADLLQSNLGPLWSQATSRGWCVQTS